MINQDVINSEYKEIVGKYGEWTGGWVKHTLNLDENPPVLSRNALHTILQVIEDNRKKSLSELRILDLGCLEGLYSLELALHGANVLGIEGREENIQKALFTKKCLGLDNADFVQDNVLNISFDKYGYFDVILCCGILYHLDVPDIFSFVENMSDMCNDFTVIDTHYGDTQMAVNYKNKQYWGTSYGEDVRHPWSSIGNTKSFWFTPFSLFNLLQNSGFSSIYQCYMPIVNSQPDNRFLITANKNNKVSTKLIPEVENLLEYPF